MMDDLKDQVERLRFQLQLLAESLDHHAYPIQTLVIALDWGDEELTLAIDIFEKYSRQLESGEKVSWVAFEEEFQDQLNISYQALKSIILAFYRNRQWLDVCVAYAQAHDVAEFWEINDREPESLDTFKRPARKQIHNIRRDSTTGSETRIG